MNVKDIRNLFSDKFRNEEFVTDKTGVKMVEIIGASFIADESIIFGDENIDYINREIRWYESQSLNVNDIELKTPEIWHAIATPDGFINSNYGWCTLSEDNGNQFNNVLKELTDKPFSRRAVMIYTRPSMHEDYCKDGMSDFICTNAVQYLIRDNKLHTVVQMRSNDAVFGYKNDYAWQVHIRNKLLTELQNINKELITGDIIWNAGSLHIYERHFKFIKNYIYETS